MPTSALTQLVVGPSSLQNARFIYRETGARRMERVLNEPLSPFHPADETRPRPQISTHRVMNIQYSRLDSRERASAVLVDNCGRDVAMLVLEKVHSPPRETRPQSRRQKTLVAKKRNAFPRPGPRHFSRQSAPPSTRAAQVRSCDAAQSNRAREASPYRLPTCRSQL